MEQEYNENFTQKKKTKKSSFEHYGFIYQLYKALVYKKFHSPLPIQKKAIPAIMQGRDIIVSSKTGSGKTLTYLIPLINKLKCHSPIVGARALILVPTRQLAKQISDVLKDLLRFTDIRYALILGGHSFQGQFQVLATNPDIIIATPGRLMQLVVETDYKLSRIEMVVFDEADNLFEKGFYDQMSQILKRCPVSQKMMFSATVPEQLDDFARSGLRDYVFIQQQISLPDKMTLDFLVVRNQSKLALLLNLLKKRSSQKAIVFASTRYQVDLLQALISKQFRECIPIYGKMQMLERNQAIYNFRASKKGILVVTDLASRGLDIPEVGLVIHFDYPSNHKIFVHRSGRTARKGESGQTIAFINSTQISYMVELCYVIGRKLVVDLNQTKDAAYFGTVPSSFYEVQEQFVRDTLKEDDEIKKYLQVSDKAMEKFRKCRTPASSYSIKLSKELQVGLHPKFRSMDDEEISFRDRLRNYNPQKSFLEIQKINQDKDETNDPFLMAVNKIRKQQFYKAQTKSKIEKSREKRQGQLEEIVKFDKQDEHKLKEYREKRSKERLPVTLPNNVEIMFDSDKAKKSHVKDFKNPNQYITESRLPGVATEFDNLQKINTNQLDDNLNDQGRLRSKSKRVWDSKSKTFKYKKDKQDKMSKDEKGKHAYLKWKKSTHLSLQKVGETEERGIVNAAQNYWTKRRKFAKGWKQNREGGGGRGNDSSQRKGAVMRKRISKKRTAGNSKPRKGFGSKGGSKGGFKGGAKGGAKGGFKGGAKSGGFKGGKRK